MDELPELAKEALLNFTAADRAVDVARATKDSATSQRESAVLAEQVATNDLASAEDQRVAARDAMHAAFTEAYGLPEDFFSVRP